jgi:hypothetical protein
MLSFLDLFCATVEDKGMTIGSLSSATEAPGQATIKFQAFHKATKRDQLQGAVEI